MVIYLKLLYRFLRNLIPVIGKGNKIDGVPLYVRLGSLRIRGNNNRIVCFAKEIGKIDITIYGNNHYLEIGEDVVFKKGSIWFEDQSNVIRIGSKTTIEEAHLSVAESSTAITIGKDCMLSSGIYISTTDSHSVISLENKERTNKAANVIVEDHVWIGMNVTINKGSTFGHDTIVGGHSICNKKYPSNSIVAGVPAKVVREGITWCRERI